MVKYKLRAVIVFLVIIVAAGSFAAGYHVAYSQTENLLRSEVVGNLTQDLVALSHLRIGQPERVVESIEFNVDRAVATLGQQDPDEWSSSLTTAMKLASLYRSMFPTTDNGARQVLISVPPADPTKCVPAFQELAKTHDSRRKE